jgi:hypothetical protein
VIDIFVVRDGSDGTHVADTIVDPLLSDTQAAVQRGRNFLDENDDLEPVTLQINYRSGLERGQIVEVHDALQGGVWRGQITGISHRVTPPVVLSDVRIIRRRL